MQYAPTGTNGQDPNSIIKLASAISTQGAANAEYDKLASQKGGKRKHKKTKRGGNSKWSWGCYSGGKRITKRVKMSRRKSRRNMKK
jgi:hypothetical protein